MKAIDQLSRRRWIAIALFLTNLLVLRSSRFRKNFLAVFAPSLQNVLNRLTGGEKVLRSTMHDRTLGFNATLEQRQRQPRSPSWSPERLRRMVPRLPSISEDIDAMTGETTPGLTIEGSLFVPPFELDKQE